MSPPPAPFHLLRNHQSSLSALSFDSTNNFLYSGDQSGHIAMTDLRKRRVICHWKAHKEGLLGVQEWDGRLIRSGPCAQLAFQADGIGKEAMGETTWFICIILIDQHLEPKTTIHRLSVRSTKGKSRMKEAFLALPNLVNSELADIYHLPSMKRIHSSINALPVSTNLPVQLTATDPMSVKPKGDRSGLIMSLHLSIQASKVALVMGFEDGRVEVWTCLLSDHDWDETWDGRFSDERMWQKVWGGKGHNEAVMAMAVDRTTSRAFTVSADHLLCRYDLKRALLSPHDSDTADDQVISSYSTKQIGNAALAISRDGKVVAVGGWDGRVRLFSAATFKPLGTLSYHRDTTHVLAFANPPMGIDYASESILETVEIGAEDDEEEDEVELDGVPPRERWLASGGKDRRVALWGLRDFAESDGG
ncbi:MAG: ASTRA complex subunit [Tremellales sp. Tagirdzhanova-0007]|nr:MAG: ASTRA complex subunit [Tremellales sp. Tagirdzhanova-0007]